MDVCCFSLGRLRVATCGCAADFHRRSILCGGCENPGRNPRLQRSDAESGVSGRSHRTAHDRHAATETGERLDSRNVPEVRAGEREARAVEHRTCLDQRQRQRANRCAGHSQHHARVGGVVAGNERRDARAGCVFRCQDSGGFREVSREAEGSHGYLPGTPESFAPAEGPSLAASTAHAGAAAAPGSTGTTLAVRRH